MPVKVLLTTMAGDTLWLSKVLETVAPTAKNGCHACYVPTQRLVEEGESKARQRYINYLNGFTLEDEEVDLINRTSNLVSPPNVNIRHIVHFEWFSITYVITMCVLIMVVVL